MKNNGGWRRIYLFAAVFGIARLTLAAQPARGAVLERILIPEESTRYERRAARELTKYLKAINGKELPTEAYKAGVDKNGAVLIGRAVVKAGLIASAELQSVKPDGYIVVSDGRTVGIAGYRGVGDVYGVYGFLRRLGLKIYAPDCKIVPKLPTLTVGVFRISDSPAFEMRYNHRLHPELGWTPRLDCPRPREADPKAGRSWDHTHGYQVPRYLYFEEHPEYWAKDEQNRMLETSKPGQLHLCLSHPEVRKIAAERVADWVDKTPLGRFYCVTQGDGAAWCRCPRCTALDPEPGAKLKRYPLYLADRLLDYVNPIANRIAEKHPDDIVLTFAYTPATQPPPRRVKPAPNVRVMFCPYPTENGAKCSSHDLFCEQNKGALEDLRGWLAWCPHNMYIYDYVRGFQCRYAPFGSFYAMVSKIKFYHEHGIKGIYLCGARPQQFGALFEYVIGRLLWHPELDPEPLIDEFMPAYYGAAAPHMRAFFDFFYARIHDKDNPVHQGCERANPGLVTPEFAAAAYPIFARARQAVRADPTLLKRVELEELCGVLWSDLDENTKEKLVSDGTVNEKLLAKLKRLNHLCRQHGARDFVRKTKGKVWITATFGIPVDAEPWWSDPVVKKLLARKMTVAELRELEKNRLQKDVAGGIAMRLTAFEGQIGPKPYSHMCPRRLAIGINPQGRGNSSMRTSFYLEAVPARAKLVLEALDDDKPGRTRIAIAVNDRQIFAGENQAAENDWTPLAFEIPGSVLRKGYNTLTVNNLEATEEPNIKWLMVSDARLMLE